MSKKSIKVELSEDEINKIIDTIEKSNIPEEYQDKIINALRAILELDRMVGLKNTTIARLRKIFGKQEERQKKKKAKDKKEAKGTTGGSGRLGKDDYSNAPVIEHKHGTLKAKDVCPECQKGRLYEYEPGTQIKITGHSPLEATIHKTQKLRCNLCGKIYEADYEGRDKDKFDPQAMAIIALLHYKASLPFYRLEKIQKLLGIPIPRSTMWKYMEKLSDILIYVWKQFLKTASNGNLFYIDDTTAKILSLRLENELNRDNKKFKTGMHTTGVISEIDENKKLVMYFTGRNYSAQNLNMILDKRTSTETIMTMSDALATNNIKQRQSLQALCLSHARRNFMDLDEVFKEEVEYILELIGKIYKNDAICKDMNLNANERLEYHKKHSSSHMKKLNKWIELSFKNKKIEPNSTLGQGMKYIQKHWKGLTAFLHHPGTPLDNNILEQKLRTPVLNRKNWLFYKNEMGAFVGDIIMTIIISCEINNINPIDYMVVIQNNFESIKSNPENWLPWNFKNN